MELTANRPTWRIVTPGPVLDFIGSADSIRWYVEHRAPLKAGWTARWVEEPDGSLTYIRTNSRGRDLPRYAISVIRTD